MQLVRMYTPRGLERDMGFVLGKPNYFVHTPPTRGRAVLAHVWGFVALKPFVVLESNVSF